MEPKKFEQIIDQHAEDWLYDSIEPVKGTWRNPDGTKTGPKRRTLHNGEVREPNETGSIQIVKWKPVLANCSRCKIKMPNKMEEINLEKQTIKCSCGQKYSFQVAKNIDI